MAEHRSIDWRGILWSLARPALVAGIVALLVALGVTGLRPPYGGDLGAMAGTTFSGPLYVTGGIQSGNNLTLTNGALINSKGAVTVTDGLYVTGAVAGVSAVWSGSQSVAGSLDVSGSTALFDLLSLGSVTVTGQTQWGTWLGGAVPTAAQAITVTTNGYITPTGSLVRLASEGNVFTSQLAVAAAGRLALLWNGGAGTVTITDTGTSKLAGNWAGGPGDTLLLWSDGTNWLELSRSDN